MDDFREIPIETRPGIGHNRALVPELDPDIDEIMRPLKARADELHAAEARVPTALDAATVGKAADFVKQIGAAAKGTEDARAKTKQPFLDAGKMIDATFKAVSDPLLALKKRIEGKIGEYQRKVEAEERRRREEEARRAAEDAAKKEAEAQTKDALDEAIEAHAEAAKAKAAVAAPPQEIARARGDFGSVATTRTAWKHEITNATKIPREYLMPNDAAIKAAVKAGVREIAGIRIYQETLYGQVR